MTERRLGGHFVATPRRRRRLRLRQVRAGVLLGAVLAAALLVGSGHAARPVTVRADAAADSPSPTDSPGAAGAGAGASRPSPPLTTLADPNPDPDPGPARTPTSTSTAPTTPRPRTVRQTAKQIDPSEFSPGACVSYPPTAGNRHLTVFLDAGHGGQDPGAVGTTPSGQAVHEADQTLPVELDAMARLRRNGFRVVVSRTRNSAVVRLTPSDLSGKLLSVKGAHADVAARAVCANRSHANLLVGIYFDGGSSPANAGCVTGYDAVRSFSADNLRFARLLQADVLSAMNGHGWQIPDEGVVQDQNLGSAVSSEADAYGHLLLLGPARRGYFTTPSRMPGALIEPLFVTDPLEAQIAARATGQQVIAGGIARAVERYFSAEE